MRIPGPKWGAGRPPLETPKSSLARPFWPNSSPLARLELRCRWGKRERVRARHGRRTSTASGWGLRPLAPQGSQTGNVCRSCAYWGLTPPCPLRPPLGKVCRSCAPAHGTASETAFAATPPQIRRGSSSRNAARSSAVPSRELRPKAAPARPPGGTCRGEAPQPVFAYFLLARK